MSDSTNINNNGNAMSHLEALKYHAERHTFDCDHPLEGVLEAAVERIKQLELDIELLEGDANEFG